MGVRTCDEGQSLSGARERIDIRPVGSSLGVFTGTAMMDAVFAQARWPSFQRLLAWIEGPSGRHSAGTLQDSGTALAVRVGPPALSPRRYGTRMCRSCLESSPIYFSLLDAASACCWIMIRPGWRNVRWSSKSVRKLSISNTLGACLRGLLISLT
jgi:hypothetical protein